MQQNAPSYFTHHKQLIGNIRYSCNAILYNRKRARHCVELFSFLLPLWWVYDAITPQYKL